MIGLIYIECGLSKSHMSIGKFQKLQGIHLLKQEVASKQELIVRALLCVDVQLKVFVYTTQQSQKP